MTPGMNDAQFIILNTKLDGLSLLIEEKLTNLEEKVDHDRRAREQANERIEKKIEAHDERITALEHDRTRNKALVAVWVTAAGVIGAVMLWLFENHSKVWKLLGSLSG